MINQTAGLISCNTNCRNKHPFNASRRAECEGTKACVCAGGSLAALNPNLHLAYLQHCNVVKRLSDPIKFLCEEIGGEALFKQYGIQDCGYDPLSSPEAQLSAERQKSQRNLLWIALATLAFLGLLLYLIRS